MSTIKSEKLYDRTEQSVESRISKSSTIPNFDISGVASLTSRKVAKEGKIAKKIYGPCDVFDYNYKTNQFWYNLIVLPVATIMKFGWKIKVEGTKNVPKVSNYVIMPNHVSHFDSFIAGAFLAPRSAPCAIGDEKLFKNKYFKKFAEMLNAFPVRKGTKNMNIVKYAIKRINSGDSMLWYPEGQRHKKPWLNKCNPGKLGSGMLAHSVRAPIIPVYVGGAEFAMPIGRRITWGRGPRSIEILVRYGKPVPLDDLRKLPPSPETSKLVVDRIINKIEGLRPKGPYKIQKTKHKQTYQQAKKLLFESAKYEKDFKVIK